MTKGEATVYIVDKLGKLNVRGGIPLKYPLIRAAGRGGKLRTL